MAAIAKPSGVDFVGRRVLVTGAASGIGQAAAVLFGKLGAELVLTDLASLDATVELVGQAKVECLRGDFTEESFVTSLLAKGPYFGLAQIAGIFEAPKTFSDDQAFDLVMEVNVRAPLKLARGCVSQMREQGEGRVVMVGSVAGRHGGSSLAGGLEYDYYAASKAGLHTLVRRLGRQAVSDNVMVNGVAPGVVQTPLFERFGSKPTGLPLGRPATPDEVAWPIAFLCSPAASYISGVILDVNGGSFVSA